METLNLAPSWFFGYVVILELIFAGVSLSISLFARKIYKETDQQAVKLLHLSFLMISISYFVQSILNFLVISKLNQNLPQVSTLYTILFYEYIGLFSQIFLMMAGWLLLLFMTCKKSSTRANFVIFLVSMLAIVLSEHPILAYYILSSTFLLFIAWHYISNYFSNKQPKTLLVMIAFILLFFGNFHFFLGVKQSIFFVVGQLFELAAYMLILANLVLVLKK